MKRITALPLLILLFIACSNEKQKIYKLKIQNNSGITITAELYNNWTGETDTTLHIPIGNSLFKTSKNNLFSFYANGYQERALLLWDQAQITILQNCIETDSVNANLAKHQTWTNQLTTGENPSTFMWTNYSLTAAPITQAWADFDKILNKLFNGEKNINKETLRNKALYTYPAAYLLLHKLTDTNGLFIQHHINHVLNKLNNVGVSPLTKEAFLTHYLMPEKTGLRTDSIIIALKKEAPTVAAKLTKKKKILETKKPLKIGQTFPSIKGTTPNGKIEKIKFTSQYTLIDFWATWCIPCIKQLPNLNNYAQKYKNTLKIISLSIDAPKDYNTWLEDTQKAPQIEHFWISDTTSIRKDLNIQGLPKMILVNKNGKIIDTNFPHTSNPLFKLWLNQLSLK